MISFDESQSVPPEWADDEQVTEFFRRFLPDFYFINTPLSRMRRHLEMLRVLPAQPLQIEFYCPPGAQFTEMMLCAHDAAKPGLLAQVSGALTALRINVHTAWIHTLRDPHVESTPEAGVVLDTLILSENYLRRTRPLVRKKQQTVARTLRKMIESSAQPTSQRNVPPLLLNELSVQPSGQYTLIKVAAQNGEGVLFRVAQTVAGLNLNIAHAQINTFDKDADDAFFVTDASNQPLDATRIGPLEAQLREALTD